MRSFSTQSLSISSSPSLSTLPNPSCDFCILKLYTANTQVSLSCICMFIRSTFYLGFLFPFSLLLISYLFRYSQWPKDAILQQVSKQLNIFLTLSLIFQLYCFHSWEYCYIEILISKVNLLSLMFHPTGINHPAVAIKCFDSCINIFLTPNSMLKVCQFIIVQWLHSFSFSEN